MITRYGPRILLLSALPLLVLAGLTGRPWAGTAASTSGSAFLPLVMAPPPPPTPTLTPPDPRIDWPCCRVAGETSGNLNDEYVCIRNYGETPIYLFGWKIRDKQGNTYTFREFTMGGSISVRIHTGGGVDYGQDVYWHMGMAIWDNTHDTIYFINGHGSIQDQKAY